ncbi:gem-associated protein 2-like [Nilaparvata lugens]|uniref:gem-associated protein 2-like n=1 Tax=Nilaparvata lugens TaxID=108931 RepID=UPI00193CA7AC|nr:gem-associated protein 2-like [Nilaparvata lugens]
MEEEEDQDTTNFLTPALYMEPLPKDYRPGTGPVTDGFEYLKRVRYEALTTPIVSFPEQQFRSIKIDDGASASYLPFTAEKVSATYMPLTSEKVTVCDETFLPSLEWQNEQVADFSDLRHAIAIRREDEKTHGTNVKEVFPEKHSEQAWFEICIKEPIKPKKFQYHAGIGKHCYKEPLLSFLLSMSQDTLLSLLENFVLWINEGHTSVQLSGRWIYCIFSVLEVPLIPEMCSALRELCKLAAKERSILEEHESRTVNTLNLIICLVGRYFSQTDLAD